MLSHSTLHTPAGGCTVLQEVAAQSCRRLYGPAGGCAVLQVCGPAGGCTPAGGCLWSAGGLLVILQEVVRAPFDPGGWGWRGGGWAWALEKPCALSELTPLAAEVSSHAGASPWRGHLRPRLTVVWGVCWSPKPSLSPSRLSCSCWSPIWWQHHTATSSPVLKLGNGAWWWPGFQETPGWGEGHLRLWPWGPRCKLPSPEARSWHPATNVRWLFAFWHLTFPNFRFPGAWTSPRGGRYDWFSNSRHSAGLAQIGRVSVGQTGQFSPH